MGNCCKKRKSLVEIITSESQTSKESRKNKFTELKNKLIKEYGFTESELNDICKYA